MLGSMNAWWQSKRRVRGPRARRFARPRLERLEGRIVFVGDTLATASLLQFTPSGAAHVSGLLATANQVDLYEVHLAANEKITADASAGTANGPRTLLRVFDAAGTQRALDDQEGGDPHLTFQAATDGFYFVGVSSQGDARYDPTAAGSGQGGATKGQYSLDVKRTQAAAQSDLAGSSFRIVGSDIVAQGESVTVSFSVENRGSLAADPSAQVQLFVTPQLALLNPFAGQSPQLALPLNTFSLAGLGPGRAFDSGAVRITIPAPDPMTIPFGKLFTGPLYIGGMIVDDPNVDLNAADKGDTHRGEDWERVTVLVPVASSGSNGTRETADVVAQPDSLLTGQLAPGQTAWFQFDTPALQLTADLTPAGGAFAPRLSLYGLDGELLVQSDGTAGGAPDARVKQYLTAGTYFVAVSARSGGGDYRLSLEGIPATDPTANYAVGAHPNSLAVGDLAGSGSMDVVTANINDNTVSVLLNNGDGTFKSQQTISTGNGPASVTVADVDGDGRPDLLVTNYHDNTVSVFLNGGGGTFTLGQTLQTGVKPTAVAVADLNGDGIPDLLVANRGDVFVSEFLGNGDGTFGTKRRITAGAGVPALSGVLAIAVGDLNGDGIPDLVAGNRDGNNVRVLLGNGYGSFQTATSYVVGTGPISVALADVNGDGNPDIVTANFNDKTVGLLLGDGHGAFQGVRSLVLGLSPRSVAVGDINGDGRLDIVVATYTDNAVGVLLGNGDGTFAPQQTFAAGNGPDAVALADITGDGSLDVVVADFLGNGVTVLPGLGDGAFQARQVFGTGEKPESLTVGDLNGDGKADAVVSSRDDNTVSVLLGNGDGTFQTQRTIAVGKSPVNVAVADLNGDGRPDLVVANIGDDTVSVLLGHGDGTFSPPTNLATGHSPIGVAVADFNGDGKLDIAVTDEFSNTVSVFFGHGDGTFSARRIYAAGGRPFAIAAADVNGDGRPDLVYVNYSDRTMRVLSNRGDGTFDAGATYPVGKEPESVAVADLNHDGRLDVIVPSHDADISVYLGNGDGTFKPRAVYPAGAKADNLSVADLDHDGNPDVVVTNYGDNDIGVLFGRGDGTFGPQQVFPTGLGPLAVAVADLNGDHEPDIVVANRNDNSISVLLGSSIGSFDQQRTFTTGNFPLAIAQGDLNGDGKPDLITANADDNTVDVFTGDGRGNFTLAQTLTTGQRPDAVAIVSLDGSPAIVVANSSDGTIGVYLNDGHGNFGPEQIYTVGSSPNGLAVGDLDGDGWPDLVVSNYGDGTVSILPGNINGTFGAATTVKVGKGPSSLAVADVNGDGKPDIVVSNYGDNTVEVLWNNGDGTFAAQAPFAAGNQPQSVAVGDLNGDGRLDLVVADAGDNKVSVFLNNGNGTFGPKQTFGVGAGPYSVQIADLNGDGRPDIVVANKFGKSVSELLGNGDGTFQTQRPFPVGNYPIALAVADVNGDGRPDISTVNRYDGTVSVLLGIGTSFPPSNPTSAVGVLNTPLLADLTGHRDGTLDSVVLNTSGDILFRRGLDASGHTFAPPVVLNPGRPARDLTLLHTATGVEVAAIDSAPHPDPTSPDRPVFDISLYAVDAGGTATRSVAFSTALLPTRIAAAHLQGSGDGPDDLVVADSLDDSVTIALQTAPGVFDRRVMTIPVGRAPSDLALVDVNGDGLRDIVLTDQSSGDVSVLFNDAAQSFAEVGRFRAGIGLNGFDSSTGTPAVASLDLTSGVVAGDFTGHQSPGVADLVAVDRGAHALALLRSDGVGFADPSLLTPPDGGRLPVPARAGPILAGHFTGASGPLDLAVLNLDTSEVWVYLGHGYGTFDAPIINYAGSGATGFSFIAGSGTTPDRISVGNAYGDILTLVGDGTGRFAVDRSDLNLRPLAVGKTPDGRPFAVVADPKLDEVQVHFRDSTSTSGFDGPQAPPRNNAAPLLAPGAVVLGDLLNTRGTTPPYLIVANSLGNQVLVYPGLPGGGFGTPTAYAVGADPVAVTVADLNGDGVPDLIVVNHGSNDLSVLIGKIDPATGLWFASAGPRLESGGNGPIAVDVADFNGDGIPDLRVTNADGTISTLGGIGSGGVGTAFFKPPTDIQNLGAAITQVAFDATTGREFVVSGGGIRSFDGTGFSTVAVTGSVNTLGVVGGLLVAGFADGSVGVLTEQGVLLDQSSSFGDQPSALQALQDGSSIDVYLTLEGSSVPAFVSLLVPVVTELPTSPAVAQATSLANADLVLVATLLTGTLEEGTQQDVQVATGEASFLLFLPAVKVGVPSTAASQDAAQDTAGVALVVQADLDGIPPTEEFKARVRDALADRLATKEVFDSVEDLVEAIKEVLDRFKPETKRDDEFPSAFEGDLRFVALDRMAEAVVAAREQQSCAGAESVRPPRAAEGESLLSLPSAFLVSWLCRAPEHSPARELLPPDGRKRRRPRSPALPTIFP